MTRTEPSEGMVFIVQLFDRQGTAIGAMTHDTSIATFYDLDDAEIEASEIAVDVRNAGTCKVPPDMTFKIVEVPESDIRDAPPTPECDRFAGLAEQWRTIEEFMDWMGAPSPGRTVHQLLAEYFEIDSKKLEAERVALLDHQRWLNDFGKPK